MRSTFCAAVDHRNYGELIWSGGRVGVVGVFYHLNHVNQSAVHPATRVDIVKTADYDLELPVPIVILVLNLAIVPSANDKQTRDKQKEQVVAYAVTLTPGMRELINLAATTALGWPTSAFLNDHFVSFYM
jgi:hypothetical protein